MPESEVHVLIRLGAELTIKSRRTRSSFQQRLIRNLKDAMKSVDAPAQVDSAWGRVYARTNAVGAEVLPRGVSGSP